MTSSTSVNDNQWHHAALTSNGLTQTLYLDGKVAGMQVAPVSLLYYVWGGLGCAIGYQNMTTSTTNLTYLAGKLDDIRVYNRVVSSSEIWKLSH